MWQLELLEGNGGIGRTWKEGCLRAQPRRSFFGNHALYIGYKCDQRPFCIRTLLGKYKKIACGFLAVNIANVYCQEATSNRKKVLDWN